MHFSFTFSECFKLCLVQSHGTVILLKSRQYQDHVLGGKVSGCKPWDHCQSTKFLVFKNICSCSVSYLGYQNLIFITSYTHITTNLSCKLPIRASKTASKGRLINFLRHVYGLLLLELSVTSDVSQIHCTAPLQYHFTYNKSIAFRQVTIAHYS